MKYHPSYTEIMIGHYKKKVLGEKTSDLEVGCNPDVAATLCLEMWKDLLKAKPQEVCKGVQTPHKVIWKTPET